MKPAACLTPEAALRHVTPFECMVRQLGEQAADASRHQAEAAGARRVAAASEQAVRAERQAAEALRQQLQEAAASLAPLRDIEVTAIWMLSWNAVCWRTDFELHQCWLQSAFGCVSSGVGCVAQARHLALAEELKGATGRVEHLSDSLAAADQEHAQLTVQLRAAQAQVSLWRTHAIV